ncbi:MAG: CopG family transcriptional regulator [Bacteroidota bacterium]|nr:MAG: CopG family transcriptional regulator [Bacteroidota bacterium]
MNLQALNKTISFRLDEKDKKQLNHYCLERNISKSQFFRELSKELLVKINYK